MSKLGMCRTSTLFVLLTLGTTGTCHTHASDRAVIEVRGEPESEVMWFRPDAVLFTDRSYRLAECPAKLAGEKFLRSSIDSTHFDVVQDGRLIVLTPQSIPRAASQAEALRAQGFSRMGDDPFQLLGND